MWNTKAKGKLKSPAGVGPGSIAEHQELWAIISEQRNHRRSDSIWKTLTTIFFATYCAIDLHFRDLFWCCIAFAGFTMMLTCFLCLYMNCNLSPRTVPFNLIKFSHISPTTTLSIASNHTHLLAIFTIAPASSIGSHGFLIFPVYSASPCGQVTGRRHVTCVDENVSFCFALDLLLPPGFHSSMARLFC